MGFLAVTKKKISGVSKIARRGSLTKGPETNPDPSMDVPTNINVQRSTRRGLQRKGTSTNFSTFSLVSLPSFKRGISQHLENPHLDEMWKYDNNVYSNYDVSAEMKDPGKVDEGKNEDAFFVANPLPSGSICSGSTMEDSWGPLQGENSRSNEHYVMDSANANCTRELIKQFVGDVWNSGDLTRIPELCSPQIIYNTSDDSSAKVGREVVAETVRKTHQYFTAFHCEIHSMVVENNKAFCRIRYSGKHSGGQVFGFPPTGEDLSWVGAVEFTCKNGQILRVWEMFDFSSLENQLQKNYGYQQTKSEI